MQAWEEIELTAEMILGLNTSLLKNNRVNLRSEKEV